MIQLKKVFLTMQGEGPNAGKASLFVRFGVCNMACSWCDTDFDNATNVTHEELFLAIKEPLELNPSVKHIVFTGGEPSIWAKELDKWTLKFGDYFKSYTIEIETNGWKGFPWEFLSWYFRKVFISCSPKFYEKDYLPINIDFDWAQLIFKPIVEVDRLVPEILDNISKIFFGGKEIDKDRIYLQPLDNSYNMSRRIIEAGCYGCQLSLQLHKILEIE